MAAPLRIRVDQAGRPPGVPGRAREDLALGTAVQLTAVGGPFRGYLWTLAFKPVDVLLGVRSSAALSSPTTSATLVQPIDRAGTYRAGIAVDAGFGLGAREEDVAFVTFYAGPTLNPSAAGYPRRPIAIGETNEHNVPDAIDLDGNVDGWGRERARWDEAAKAQGVVFLEGEIDSTDFALLAPGVRSFSRNIPVATNARIMGIAKVGLSAFDNGAGATYHMNLGWDVFLDALVEQENVGVGTEPHFDPDANHAVQKIGFPIPASHLVMTIASNQDLRTTTSGSIELSIAVLGG